MALYGERQNLQSPETTVRDKKGHVPILKHNIKAIRHCSLDTGSLPVRRSTQIDGIRCVGNYDIGKTIGKGKFGTVKLATHVLTRDVVCIMDCPGICISDTFCGAGCG